MGCLTSNKPFDFGGDPARSRIFVGIYAVTDKRQFAMIFRDQLPCRRFAAYKCFYNFDQHGLTATGAYGE